MSALVDISFHGVRGSTPCSCDSNQRYGGNTACVSITTPGSEPIILDLGTGLRFFGREQPLDGSFRGHALVTHLHWDHVQGLPFFAPLHHPGSRLDIYGPPQEGLSLAEAFEEFMRPPYFPVRVADLGGSIEFHTLEPHDVAIGDAKVRSRFVPHIGPTYGYRVEIDSVTIAYISDHQQPLDGSNGIADEVLELADGVDVLIHDAQYTEAEFADKAHWGHCTVDYALHVAGQAGAHRLVLFHHDPGHGDELVDDIVREVRDRAPSLGIAEVIAAAEGLTIALDATGAGR